MKLDQWMVHGFSGLLQLCQNRAANPAGVEEQVARDFLSKVELYKSVALAFKEKVGKEPKTLDLSGMDSWMWRGLHGMVNMLQHRTEQIAEPMNNVQFLKKEIVRLQQLVEKLELLQRP